MADYGFIANAPQTSPMSSVKDILGFAQGAQALQQGNVNLQRSTATLPSDIAKAQAESTTVQSGAQRAQQEMGERQYLQGIMKSGKDEEGKPLKDDSGEFSPTALSAAITRNMPLTGQPILQSIIKTQDDRLKLSNSVRGLAANYRDDISGIVRSSIGTADTPQDIAAKLDAYGKQNPSAAPSIARATTLIQTLDPKVLPQEHRDKALLHLAQEFQPSGTTVNEQAPKVSEFTTKTGERGYEQTNPLSPVPMGQVGPTVEQGVPPTIVQPPGGVPTVMEGKGSAPNAYGGVTPTSQDMEAFGHYQSNLNNRVQIATDLIPRVQQAEEALDQIRAGAGSKGFEKLGRILQAIHAPQSLVDAVSNGSLSATQEAEKYLFQTTFSGLKQSMQGDPARVAEFNSAEQVFPNIGTDPRATKAVLNFMADQAKRDYAEQQALVDARKSGKFNPVTWQAEYQKQLRAGSVPEVPKSQVPKTKEEKSVTQAEVDAYAKKHNLTPEGAKKHIEASGIKIQ